MQNQKLNKEVSRFLDSLNHPFRAEIEVLRNIILDSDDRLEENIKWNGPNYFIGDEDRITMKIQPPKMIQLIFHCGAKSKAQPNSKLITEDGGLLDWKTNDRAVASFRSFQEIETNKTQLSRIISEWIRLTS